MKTADGTAGLPEPAAAAATHQLASVVSPLLQMLYR
jgi:hypothetical protein